MRCNRTAVQILLIVSILNVVLTAPVAVREMHEARVNVMDARMRPDPWEQSSRNVDARVNVLPGQGSSPRSSSAPSRPTSSTGPHPGLTPNDSPSRDSWKRWPAGGDSSESPPSSPELVSSGEVYKPTPSPSSSSYSQSSEDQHQQDGSPTVSGPTDRIHVASLSPQDSPHQTSLTNQLPQDGSSLPVQGPVPVDVSTSSPPRNPHHPSLSNQGQQDVSSPSMAGQGPTDSIHVSSPSPSDSPDHPSLSNEGQQHSTSSPSSAHAPDSDYSPSAGSPSDSSEYHPPGRGQRQQGGTSPPSPNQWSQGGSSAASSGSGHAYDPNDLGPPSDGSRSPSSWIEGADSYRWNQEPIDDHSPSPSLSSAVPSTVPPQSVEDRPPPSPKLESENFLGKLLDGKFHMSRQISDSFLMNTHMRAMDVNVNPITSTIVDFKNSLNVPATSASSGAIGRDAGIHLHDIRNPKNLVSRSG